jgi:hypothetical protein
MGATCLMVLLASFLPGESPVEGWTFDFHPLLYSGVDARWTEGEPVMDDWEADFSTRLSARSDIFDVSATGAFRADSTVRVTLRRARAGVRWPGSPWIATGIGLADGQPFEPGLPVPLVELGWMDIDSIRSFTAGYHSWRRRGRETHLPSPASTPHGWDSAPPRGAATTRRAAAGNLSSPS